MFSREELFQKIEGRPQGGCTFFGKGDQISFSVQRGHPCWEKTQITEFARQTYRLALDVFDARALSEMLADSELFWLAQEYLSIPSDLLLAVPKSSHKWYEEALNIEIDPADLVAADFFKLKDAVRFATRESSYRSDLPALLSKLRVFRRYQPLHIQHRAFYEDFVASLRGLEGVRGFATDLQIYFSSVALSDDTSEMTDASILIGYSVGAMARGLLEVDIETIRKWRLLILDRVGVLLKESNVSKGRQCSLLSTQGFLSIFDWIENAFEGTTTGLNAAKAISIWRKMIKEVRYAPMFPLETFGKLLSQLAGYIEETRDFSRLVAETDRLLAERFGKQKLAEQAFERAKSYQKAGKVLEAIDALHKAHTESFTEETKEDSVHYCIFLAKSYSEIGLHFAAKCYALGAAFAALKLDDDSLRGLAFRGLTEAASSDHASGGSMEFFLTASAFFFVSHEFSMTGAEQTKQFEWARIDLFFNSNASCILF